MGVLWLAATLALAAPLVAGTSEEHLLDQGYHDMYNLEFAKAHETFAEYEGLNPSDPMGPVSDGAADLFAELNRLHVLESEFFTDDAGFVGREHRLAADPAAKRTFEQALQRSHALAPSVLARSPQDEDASLAVVLEHGLRADYLSLIEKDNWSALSEAKQARKAAQRLLEHHPTCYDAYLAIGVENYLLSLKSLPVRWLLRMGGAQADRQTGIDRLRITAEKGRYLLPFARLVLALAAIRDKDVATARRMLSWLASEFPNNSLYREELRKLE